MSDTSEALIKQVGDHILVVGPKGYFMPVPPEVAIDLLQKNMVYKLEEWNDLSGHIRYTGLLKPQYWNETPPTDDEQT